MSFYTTINSFDNVEIDISKKTLILCDIDETILTSTAIDTFSVVHTDYKGYQNMLNKLSPKSGLCFLTARDEGIEDITNTHLKLIGIRNRPQIYFTGNISKGTYMKQKMDISFYEDVIFIDDNTAQLSSVHKEYPNIRCYRFEIDYLRQTR